jgi:hypothetical protein
MELRKRHEIPPLGPPPSPSRPHRGWMVAGLVSCLVLVLAGGGYYLANRPEPPSAPTSGPPAQGGQGAATSTSEGLPPLSFGFYSAGLQPSPCYGSCKPGTPAAKKEASTKQRIGELAAMHVNFVIDYTSPKDWFVSSPKAFLTFLNDLHRHGIRISYGLASGRRLWFRQPRAVGPARGFTTEIAEAEYKATDRDGDGVSDLDGKIDAIYLSHEVLEWADHIQRVEMYRATKRWLPHTPVSVYYGSAMSRPTHPAFKDRPHRRGGTWADYAYGPGEADIVHLAAHRPFLSDRFDVRRSTDDLKSDIEVVRRATPDVPIFVSTSFAYDPRMARDPTSMWTPAQIQQWYEAVRSVNGVRGVFLRSYHRFTFDLGNSRFAAQRAQWAKLGSAVASSSP